MVIKSKKMVKKTIKTAIKYQQIYKKLQEIDGNYKGIIFIIIFIFFSEF